MFAYRMRVCVWVYVCGEHVCAAHTCMPRLRLRCEYVCTFCVRVKSSEGQTAINKKANRTQTPGNNNPTAQIKPHNTLPPPQSLLFSSLRFSFSRLGLTKMPGNLVPDFYHSACTYIQSPHIPTPPPPSPSTRYQSQILGEFSPHR